jgi:tetratricopeptide (TPR) repeat protein
MIRLQKDDGFTGRQGGARSKAAGKQAPVRAWSEAVAIPTYMPAAPDLNPMFLEKRVYQGSSGKVYPLPFTDRIADEKADRLWNVVWLENRFLQVMILPEIGGRIHAARDKTNGFDFIYRQNVIKPALVGLAGPWISGGIEFNWPQHHRPDTFLPADYSIERHPDGSVTVWLSTLDPISRMKGMHGVCLHPDRAVIELKVRASNRTTLPQSFLWWANAGIRTHEAYQSFFPPDVHYVADHARRSTCEYPLCQGSYYGVNYGERARLGVPPDERPSNFVPPNCGGSAPVQYPPNDLSWYANIPTPCSYMCMGSSEDFFGGYDHNAQAGIVHVADHHIAPGKKQWTWGNHNFGYAWDRNLTDSDGPYIELMAGVYTDNQPDFSFLQPGETRSWSQFWYPIQKIGVAHHANVQAAVHLDLDDRHLKIGVSVSTPFPKAVIRLEGKGSALTWTADLAPGHPFLLEDASSPGKWKTATLRVLAQDGREIIAYSPKPRQARAVPPPATEPPPPGEISTAEELYVTGLHLEQYRHATRCPTLYWREALRRDPLDAHCNNALGLWHLRRGEFTAAHEHFENAIQRLTRRNPNPRDSEPYYNLGLCLCHLGLFTEAEAALHKAAWNQAWQPAAWHALAELACRRQDWSRALELTGRALRANADNSRARNLRVIILDILERRVEAQNLLRETLALDPLDGWACHLAGRDVPGGWQTRLDIALDFERAGLYGAAIKLLSAPQPSSGPRPAAQALPTADWGAAPLVQYYLGWLHEKNGDPAAARRHYQKAAAASPDYCFPSRLEEIAILQAALRANQSDARAAYYLGNLFYDRRRHEEAIRLWEKSAKLDPAYSVVWRNLGIGYFNIARKPRQARAAYDKAVRANPSDARLIYERDQLWKRLGDPPQKRLRELEKHIKSVDSRDDLSIELCALYNQLGAPGRALAIVGQRHFQPWEGGEGQALAQHVRTHLSLGKLALARQDCAEARARFEAALATPENLGEARHLLANQSDIYYWLGHACDALNDSAAARKYWQAAASFRGDFQEMSARHFSEMTYYSALAWGRLGQAQRMKKLLRDLLEHARQLGRTPAKIDYFATSLPTMLLFDDDIQFRQQTTALFLEAQARLGLGQKAAARRVLAAVLQRDPNHAPALDLTL